MISKNYQMVSKRYRVEVLSWYSVYFLLKSALDGTDAIKSFQWKALIDPDANPNHPGVRNGGVLSGTLSPNNIRWISTSDFEIELPDSSPDDPGLLVGAEVTAMHCPIQVSIKFEGTNEGLGLAGQGSYRGENLVVYNSEFPDSFVDTLLHELGHSMGQTVFAGYNEPPAGLMVPKTSVEIDLAYAYKGSKGHVYIGRGHSGPHCSYGLDDEEKKSAFYTELPGICIMFGENSGEDPSLATMGYCPLCLDYIKSRNLLQL